MPELPEVETIRRGLQKSIKGKTIERVELMRPNLRIPFPDNFCERLEGRKIKDIKRRSKYLLIELDNDEILISHLGMSGKILIEDTVPETLKKHDHVLIELSDGGAFIYNDARRFGLMTLVKKDELNEHKLFKDLGPEPLEKGFTNEVLFNSLKNKTTPIKNTIMDAHIVVGVGNIYACESLFRSGISPTKPSSKISKTKISELTENIKQILKEAIASGGSTLRDYVQSDGELGYFQHKFSVYGRENEPCYTCKKPIKRIKQQGRSTFYCAKCQK